MKRIRLQSSVQMVGLLLVVGGSVLLGLRSVGFGSAVSYTHNPVGFADYCNLNGNNTVLTGWAYDPDATSTPQPNVTMTVGGVNHTVNTSINGYRTTDINNYLAKHYPGAPLPGYYGWQLSISGLYKGGSYVVSGTVINVGSGSNQSVGINSSSNVLGPMFNANKTIPDTCLANRPSSPPPSGGGSSGSSSGGNSSSSGGGSSSNSGGSSSTGSGGSKNTGSSHNTGSSGKTNTGGGSGGGNPAPALPGSDANASVKVGTASAQITIPNEGASQVHVEYGQKDAILTPTGDQAASGDSTTVTLVDLKAVTEYSFTIVRTNSAGGSSTSPAASFTTKGYVISLSFNDGHGNAVSGIAGTINDGKGTTATSDNKGVMQFNNLVDGTYTVTYAYQGQTYTKDFDTTTADSSSTNPDTISLSDAINVSKLAPASTDQANNSHADLIIVIAVIVFVLGAFALWFFWWRKRPKKAKAPKVASKPADILDSRSAAAFAKQQPAPAPLPAHAGKSLREMVLESMREHPLPESQLPSVPGAGHGADDDQQQQPPSA